MSQFPLTIPAQSSKDILIYYNPTNINLQTDTIFIKDYCNTHKLILSGFGNKSFYSANASCNVNVVITTRSVPNTTIQLNLPAPNPIYDANICSIPFTIITDASSPNLDMPSLQLLNLIGEQLKIE